MAQTKAKPPNAGIPQVELRPISALVGYARNSRTHSPEQVAQLKASIVEWGFTNPILVDAASTVAGHGRSMAMRELHAAGVEVRFPNGTPIPAGMIPVIDCTGWSETQRRAYIIADNKLALNAGWDTEMLRVEMVDLQTEAFDLGLTGFSAEEVDLTLNGWDSDIDVAERDGEHTDGIQAIVKVKVDQDAKERAEAIVHEALRNAGIAFE